MKLLFIIIIGIMSIFHFSDTYALKKDIFNLDDVHFYEITRIRKINKFYYLIYVKDEEKECQIISKIDSFNNIECNKIKVGNNYPLVLWIVFPYYGKIEDHKIFHKSIPSFNIGKRKYWLTDINSGSQKYIRTRKRYHYSIYIALNLKGLCVDQKISSYPRVFNK